MPLRSKQPAQNGAGRNAHTQGHTEFGAELRNVPSPRSRTRVPSNSGAIVTILQRPPWNIALIRVLSAPPGRVPTRHLGIVPSPSTAIPAGRGLRLNQSLTSPSLPEPLERDQRVSCELE